LRTQPSSQPESHGQFPAGAAGVLDLIIWRNKHFIRGLLIRW
jgi:hypothetical protein